MVDPKTKAFYMTFAVISIKLTFIIAVLAFIGKSYPITFFATLLALFEMASLAWFVWRN